MLISGVGEATAVDLSSSILVATLQSRGVFEVVGIVPDPAEAVRLRLETVLEEVNFAFFNYVHYKLYNHDTYPRHCERTNCVRPNMKKLDC